MLRACLGLLSLNCWYDSPFCTVACNAAGPLFLVCGYGSFAFVEPSLCPGLLVISSPLGRRLSLVACWRTTPHAFLLLVALLAAMASTPGCCAVCGLVPLCLRQSCHCWHPLERLLLLMACMGSTSFLHCFVCVGGSLSSALCQ